MNELIKKYQYIVDIIINRYFPKKRNDEDIRQIGMIALWNGLKKYDSSKGVKIETFITNCIKNSILDEIKKETAIKNKLNLLHNVVSLDSSVQFDSKEVQLHEFIKGDRDIECIDLKEFINSLNDCEIQIIRLKQHKKTDTEIKKTLNLSRKRYEKSLNSAKEKLKKNVL